MAKKTRAYTAIFQYGGVLIPDDSILKGIHPGMQYNIECLFIIFFSECLLKVVRFAAYLEALLRFMAEENAIHQKVFWVMNVRYQAYKKLGSQR